eukprot:8256712-Lingulodinium_polyedra.AAC.1
MERLAWRHAGAGNQALLQPPTSGPSGRVQAFLWGLLAAATQRRYGAACAAFSEYCVTSDIPFRQLTEEEQDW